MSGISALKSKLNKLKKFSPLKKKKISVAYINEDGSIDFGKNYGENCNDGVLAVPKSMTEKEWVEFCSR